MNNIYTEICIYKNWWKYFDEFFLRFQTSENKITNMYVLHVELTFFYDSKWLNIKNKKFVELQINISNLDSKNRQKIYHEQVQLYKDYIDQIRNSVQYQSFFWKRMHPIKDINKWVQLAEKALESNDSEKMKTFIKTMLSSFKEKVS